MGLRILLTTRRETAEKRNPIALLDLAAYWRRYGHRVDCYYLDQLTRPLRADASYDLVGLSVLQVLRETRRIVYNDPQRMPYNWIPAAEVVYQLNDVSIRVTFGERKDIMNSGAAKTVNALVVVAYHRQVLAITCQKLDNALLYCVRVLIFINQDFLVLGL